ncbi:MAG: site-specific integrase [Candidatus Thermoplasmatota archaeon]
MLSATLLLVAFALTVLTPPPLSVLLPSLTHERTVKRPLAHVEPGGAQRTLLDYESMTSQVWQVDKMTRLRTTLQSLRKSETPAWQWDDLITYLRQYKRRQPSTISTRLRQLAFMGKFEPMPVKLNGTREEIVNTFCMYVTYRESVDEVPATSLINDHKAIRVLGDFLAIPREVWPTAPTMPANDEREIPTPEMVSELLHADWFPSAKRSYANALLRYLLAFDFGFGIRFPSEPHAMKVADVNLEKHVITITEPKKSGRRRRLLIEPSWLCCSQKHLSLENWLRWRDKLGAETDALFPTPEGQAFPSKYAMQRFVVRTVTPRFPWFYPYLGRHWSVNARLIDWGFDYARVAAWHGHESVNMTKNAYEHSARLHESLHGGNWLGRAFKKPKKSA